MWIPELVDREGIPLQMGVVKSVFKVVEWNLPPLSPIFKILANNRWNIIV
jgi:hypothetical protein